MGTDELLFWGSIGSTGITVLMMIFVMVKGRGTRGYPVFKEKSAGLVSVHMTAGGGRPLCRLAS